MGIVSIICLACTKSTQFIVKAFHDSFTVSKILHNIGSQMKLIGGTFCPGREIVVIRLSIRFRESTKSILIIYYPYDPAYI
jgi:hypothetical protein